MLRKPKKKLKQVTGVKKGCLYRIFPLTQKGGRYALDYYIIIRNNENKIRPDQIAESLKINFSLHMNNETGLLTGDGLTVNTFTEHDEESVFSNSPYPDVCVSFRIDKFESHEKGVAAMLNILFWLIRNVNENIKTTNPYIAKNPVGGGEAFIGRADVLRDVLRVLKSPYENGMVLYGQRRIGKTSVLLEMAADLPQKGSYSPVYFDLQDKAALM